MNAAIRRRDAFSPRQPTPLVGRVTLFLGCMAMVALNLSGCKGGDLHPSTPSLKWVD